MIVAVVHDIVGVVRRARHTLIIGVVVFLGASLGACGSGDELGGAQPR